jgi:hypothetical protein
MQHLRTGDGADFVDAAQGNPVPGLTRDRLHPPLHPLQDEAPARGPGRVVALVSPRRSGAFCLEPLPDIHPPLLACIGQPELLSRVGCFQPPILPARELCPVDGKAKLHHFCRQVPAVWQGAFCNRPAVIIHGYNLCPHCLPFAQANQRKLCVFPIGMIEFRGINPEQSDLGLLNRDGVAINHISWATKDI